MKYLATITVAVTVSDEDIADLPAVDATPLAVVRETILATLADAVPTEIVLVDIETVSVVS